MSSMMWSCVMNQKESYMDRELSPSEAPENFNLKRVCLDIIKSLEASSPQNLIKLNIDIELEDSFKGDLFGFVATTKELATWLSKFLVNGVVKIEIIKYASANQEVTLKVALSAFGTDNANHSLQLSAANSNELDQLIQSLPVKVTRKQRQENLVLEFRVKLTDLSGKKRKVEFEGVKVLIAEDNEVNAMVFYEFLSEWGCDVTIVGNGAEAVAQLKNRSYDLVLMDIYMPELNGQDATEQIRQFDKQTPIVMLTASNSEDDLEKCITYGANDFILKPISSSNLLRILRKYIPIIR
ncbi:MAG: response regulator [Cyclobacteriaceae bacterium]